MPTAFTRFRREKRELDTVAPEQGRMDADFVFRGQYIAAWPLRAKESSLLLPLPPPGVANSRIVVHSESDPPGCVVGTSQNGPGAGTNGTCSTRALSPLSEATPSCSQTAGGRRAHAPASIPLAPATEVVALNFDLRPFRHSGGSPSGLTAEARGGRASARLSEVMHQHAPQGGPVCARYAKPRKSWVRDWKLESGPDGTKLVVSVALFPVES